LAKTVRIALLLLAALAVLAGVGIAATWEPDRSVASLEARWAPRPSAFIDVAGLRVHYRDEGPGDDPTPIVLLHGTSASLHTWEGWVAALRGQRRVVTLDMPGFGLTGPNPEGDYSDAAYVRFMLAALDALQLQRVVLGGNSLGGGVAWQTALAAPQRVAALILVDAVGYPFVPESIPLGFRLARIPVLNRLVPYVLPRSLIESSVRDVYGDARRVNAGIVDRYFEVALRAGNRRALVQRLALTQWSDRIGDISSLRLPTLILWGGRDRLIPPEHAQRFAKDIAGSTLVMFDDLGHVPQEEDPPRTVAPVRRFLGLPG
jgi:pimeloyl-ACP methyl ester carboxylesterase